MINQEKMNIIFSKWMDKTFGVLQFVYAERGDGDFFIQDENKTIGLLKNSEIRLFYPRLFQHVEPMYMFAFYKTMNGKVIEIRTYNPKPHSPDPDWDFEHFIVPESESLSDKVANLAVMKGLEK